MRDKSGDMIRLQHVLDAIDTIHNYIGSSSLEDFQHNSMMQDACIRQLQIIGEATNQVSDSLQNQHPEIQWAQINGLRNIIIHEYSRIDVKVVWDIIDNDLTSLYQAATNITLEMEEEE